MIMLVCVTFVFFKQKTAYELRISDWSSDVCSSDRSSARLSDRAATHPRDPTHRNRSAHGSRRRRRPFGDDRDQSQSRRASDGSCTVGLIASEARRSKLEEERKQQADLYRTSQLGRETCRERVCT